MLPGVDEPPSMPVSPKLEPSMETNPAQGLRVTVIERRRGWGLPDFAEMWRYRDLLLFLAWRDIKVRYKQTVLGAVWAVLQPLAPMVVFSLSISRIARDIHDPVPYPLFVFTGFLLWMNCANALVSAGQSLIGNHNLVTKVYFPRLLIPLGAVAAAAVDLAIGAVLLVALIFSFNLSGDLHVTVSWGLLMLPVIVLGLLLVTAGAGIFLSALTVAYRDFKHAVPFLVQLGMFATPSIFVQKPNIFGPNSRLLMLLNPIHGLIVNFRAALFNEEFDLPVLAAAFGAGILLVLVGGFYFRQVERSFADMI